MAIKFPINPTVGQQYNLGNRTWEWSGTRWLLIRALSQSQLAFFQPLQTTISTLETALQQKEQQIQTIQTTLTEMPGTASGIPTNIDAGTARTSFSVADINIDLNGGNA
jgi:hypothetical protein